MSSSHNAWAVRLGPTEWPRFTYERPPGDRLTLLGVVSRGIQIGALAQTADGQFLQVNGDHESPLPAGAMRRLVEKAGRARPAAPPRTLGLRRTPTDAPAPVVTVKKRRVVVRPDDAGVPAAA